MIENFLIIPNALKNKSVEFVSEIAKYLTDKGKKVYVPNKFSNIINCESDITFVSSSEDLKFIDMAVILGGDGTVLRNISYIKHYEIPIFGVNFGNVGYLTQCEPESAMTFLDRVLNGDFEIEDRIMLRCTVDGEEKAYTGINEVVLHRQSFGRAMHLNVYINDNFIESFSADGVLVSTPTGSTAYNMSAGGPVVIPCANNFVITPICAHAMAKSSIVTSGDDTVRIKASYSGDEEKEACLIVDSIDKCIVSDQDIKISKSKYKLKLVKFNDNSFYQTLKYKLSKEYQ